MLAEQTTISTVLQQNSGIRLDIGCGGHKVEGFVGMDIRPLPGVDIVWDVTKFPWPLPDNSVLMALTSHLIEHIPPFAPDPRLLGLIKLLGDKGIVTDIEVSDYCGSVEPMPIFIHFMNEVWRVLKPEGEFWVSCPHAFSPGQAQDPTHINPINEITFAYFDPERTEGILWGIYRPFPWKIKQIRWSTATNIEVVMVKRPLDYLEDKV